MYKTLAAVFALACAASSFGEHFALESTRKITRVVDPQISPDGKSIVFAVSRPNYEDDHFDVELVLIDVASRKQRVLTRGRPGIGSARWSPSGDRLAYLATVRGQAQIFVLPMNGGDSLQITKMPTGVQQFAWRPDGEAIALASMDEAPKRTGEERHNDAFEVGNNDFLIKAAPLPTHLWLVPAAGVEPRRLTSGSWTLPVSHPPSPPASPIEWSPDGKSIAFVRLPDAYSGDADHSSIRILDIATGVARAVTGRSKDETLPIFSPDGSRLAYSHPRGGLTRNVQEVYVTRISGGEGMSITRKIDRNISRMIWMPDGKSLVVGANDGTGTGLWIQPTDGPARRIQTGNVSVSGSFCMEI